MCILGIFNLFKKSTRLNEPPIPESEKKYYRPDDYYTHKAHPGTIFERDVIVFDERKKTTVPSEHGLYVAEILLLEYCSYGTYPRPKTGYPGFWWFEYGIRNVGARLQSLEERGFITMGDEKYSLTDLGRDELKANGYVPYMHKTKLKTTEAKMYGPEFNVWSVHREINERNTKDWMSVVLSQKEERERFFNRNKGV